MRRLILKWDCEIPEKVFHLLSLGATEGVLCPGLRRLRWEAYSHILPFYRLIISPTLTSLSLTYTSFFLESLEKELSIVQPVMMGLDTSSLQRLHLQLSIPKEASRQTESVVSSAVLRCGPALVNLAVFSPISDAAMQHIMQLPNLITWYAMNRPPMTLNLPLSNAFPRLDDLELVEEVSLEWLTLFTTTAHHASLEQNPHSPLNCGLVQRLDRLVTYPRVPVDAVFMAPILLFRGLVTLGLTSACYAPVPGCGFLLTDNDITEIATALPRLEEAVLGIVCSANSCQTTAAPLVSFSTRCRQLQHLEIHFKMKNLRHDLESVSADPRLDNLLSLQPRGVSHLSLSNAPYTINEDDVVAVLKRFRRIFPSLVEISGNDTSWGELNLRLREL